MREQSNITSPSCRCHQINASIKIGEETSLPLKPLVIVRALRRNLVLSLMYVQMVESRQTVWNMPWRKHTSHWVFISWVTSHRPGPHYCHPPRKLRRFDANKLADIKLHVATISCVYIWRGGLWPQAFSGMLKTAETLQTPLRDHQSFHRNKNFRIPGKHLQRTAHVSAALQTSLDSHRLRIPVKPEQM